MQDLAPFHRVQLVNSAKRKKYKQNKKRKVERLHCRTKGVLFWRGKMAGGWSGGGGGTRIACLCFCHSVAKSVIGPLFQLKFSSPSAICALEFSKYPSLRETTKCVVCKSWIT